MKDEGNEKITITKLALWKGIAGVFALLFAISLFTGGFGIGSEGATAKVVAAPNTNNAVAQGGTQDLDINLEGMQLLGDANAPIKIVEFSDFQCPFCSRAATDAVAGIKKNYVDSGDVAIYYAHFPLESIHPEATPSAVASECAGEQGKFWEYHDKLFANQGALNSANYKKWAGELGLNQANFDACLTSGKYESKVSEQQQRGLSVGVRGTPGFVVLTEDGDQLISGAQPFAVFQSVIENALN